MWFCVGCREKIEQHIVTDRKIEEVCREIMMEYEQRISCLEKKIETKCGKEEVRDIIKEEIAQAGTPKVNIEEDTIRDIVQEAVTNKINTIESDVSRTNTKTPMDSEEQTSVTAVMEEINERKKREKNMLIFGIPESTADDPTERQTYDLNQVNELFTDCDITLDPANIENCKRLGKYNAEKTRPILTALQSVDVKVTLFKNMYKAKKMPKYEKVGVSNDLTKTERQEEKKLFSLAQELQQKEGKGEFLFKVKGPPWARRIVKVQK